jgi:cytochrome P450
MTRCPSPGRPPGPKGAPVIGVMREFRRQPADFLLSTANRYGDLSYFKMGQQHMYLLNRPDLIQDVLVTYQRNFIKSRILQRAKVLLGEGLLTSEGDFHLRQRRLVQPAFYRERLISYAHTMVSCAGRIADRWRPGETRDMADEMMRVTLSIVGLTLFSKDVERDATGIGHALTDVLSVYKSLSLPFSNVLQRLPLPHFRRIKQAQAFLDQTIYRIIAERRAGGLDTGDLLSMLLLTVDEEGGEGMTDKQVRDEALTLFLAGHETTATALAWTWYLLSQNSDADAKMRREIHEVLGARPAQYDDIPNLPYTASVLAESMRLYPPAWAIGRMAVNDTCIENCVIPSGSICLVSPYVMHRDSRYYSVPERFEPERFTPEAKRDRPRFAYFPFGGGPRVCIGERFAWMEGVLVLATIAQRWRFSLVPGHAVEPHPQITLRTRHGVRMILHPAAQVPPDVSL